jgi:hypothetical protein
MEHELPTLNLPIGRLQISLSSVKKFVERIKVKKSNEIKKSCIARQLLIAHFPDRHKGKL